MIFMNLCGKRRRLGAVLSMGGAVFLAWLLAPCLLYTGGHVAAYSPPPLYYLYVYPYANESDAWGGGSYGAAPTGPYAAGTQVTLQAQPAEGFTFVRWEVAGEADPVLTSSFICTIDNHKFINLYFDADWELTVGAVGEGTVTVSPSQPDYNHMEQVTLTATPAAGWVFDHWLEMGMPDGNPATITLTSDWQATAVFPREYTLTTMVSGEGTVSLDPPGGVYVEGTAVRLEAAPAADWHFVEWTGDLLGAAANPIDIVVNWDVSAGVLFEDADALGPLPAFTVTAGVVGEGTVVLDPPGGTYRSGTALRVSAWPNAGHGFDYWRGGFASTLQSEVFGVYGDSELYAHFSPSVLAGNPALEAAAAGSLGLVGGVTEGRALGIRALSLGSGDITDLAGIGAFEDLEDLDLSDNGVVDLSPLAALIYLRALDLSGNGALTNIGPLSVLQHLVHLDLTGTAVQDLADLGLCTSGNWAGGNGADS